MVRLRVTDPTGMRVNSTRIRLEPHHILWSCDRVSRVLVRDDVLRTSETHSPDLVSSDGGGVSNVVACLSLGMSVSDDRRCWRMDSRVGAWVAVVAKSGGGCC